MIMPCTSKRSLAAANDGLQLPPTCLLVHAVSKSVNIIRRSKPRVSLTYALSRTAASKNSETASKNAFLEADSAVEPVAVHSVEYEIY